MILGRPGIALGDDFGTSGLVFARLFNNIRMFFYKLFDHDQHIWCLSVLSAWWCEHLMHIVLGDDFGTSGLVFARLFDNTRMFLICFFWWWSAYLMFISVIGMMMQTPYSKLSCSQVTGDLAALAVCSSWASPALRSRATLQPWLCAPSSRSWTFAALRWWLEIIGNILGHSRFSGICWFSHWIFNAKS